MRHLFKTVVYRIKTRCEACGWEGVDAGMVCPACDRWEDLNAYYQKIRYIPLHPV